MAPSPAPNRLADRLGVEISAGLREEIESQVRRAGELGRALLARQGLARTLVEPLNVALPPSFQEVLELTVSEARASGHAEHADALLGLYADSLPLALIQQQQSCELPNSWLFHEPIPWDRLPRFRRGLEALFEALSGAGLDAADLLAPGSAGSRARRRSSQATAVEAQPTPGGPSEAWGGAERSIGEGEASGTGDVVGEPSGAASRDVVTPGRWLARFATLGELYAATYFGASFPMFAAHQNDLAALEAQAKASDGLGAPDRWAIVDHRLGPALLHELLHFGRDRETLFPPYLDEALAGYLGVRFARETAFPEPGYGHALEGFPWFAQVGQAMVRAFGLGPVLAAQVGALEWPEALGEDLVRAVERLGWHAYLERRPIHFHPDTARPERWAKLFYLAARGEALDEVRSDDLDAIAMSELALPVETAEQRDLEREMLEHALAAMCLQRVRVEGTSHVRLAPPCGPVELDFRAGLCSAPGRPGDVDPAPLYVLPPSLCTARVANAETSCSAIIVDPREASLARLAAAIVEGAVDRTDVGWRLSVCPETSG